MAEDIGVPQAILDAINGNPRIAEALRRVLNGNEDRNRRYEGGRRNERLNVNINNVNPNIPIPVFDPAVKRANNYLREIEGYFRAQGFVRDKWLATFGVMLPEDRKKWFSWKTKTVRTWDEFCRAFEAQYDTHIDKKTRETALANKVQTEEESADTYIWSMVDLAEQVNPNEDIEVTVRRARDGLLPYIRRGIAHLPEWTPEALIQEARRAEQDHKSLKEYRSDKAQSEDAEGSEEDDGHVMFAQGRATFNGNRGQMARPQGSRSFNVSSNVQGVPAASAAQGSSRGQRSMQPRGRSHARVVNRGLQCYGCAGYGHVQNRCPANSLSDVDWAEREHVICFKCQGHWHLASECTSGEVPNTGSFGNKEGLEDG